MTTKYHQISLSDTSGIELYVTENNPKTLNALIKNPKNRKVMVKKLLNRDLK